MRTEDPHSPEDLADALAAIVTPSPEQRAQYERQQKSAARQQLIVSAAAMALVLIGCGVGAVQCLLWLHDGRWTPVTNWTAWNYAGLTLPLGMEWVGVAKIIVWLMEQSLGITLVLVGGGLLWLGEASNDRYWPSPKALHRRCLRPAPCFHSGARI